MPTEADDARQVRERQDGLDQTLDRAGAFAAQPMRALVVKTIHDPAGTTYPATAHALYPAEVQGILGTGVIGAAFTFDPFDTVIAVANVGNTAIPVNTVGLIAVFWDGHWVVDY